MTMQPLLVLLLLLVCSLVSGDLYLHQPRGSNNRLDEQSRNARNQQRLFDSQNNARGGYPVGESGTDTTTTTQHSMYYFEGSVLRLQWANQHGCGDNSKLHCQFILQYTCSDASKKYSGELWNMTNGHETGAAGTQDPPHTGLIEPLAYRRKCEKRLRNTRLYLADQRLQTMYADSTRQNTNANRYGNECPEERDYYPYWHPTIWKDIAVLVDDTDRCPYYKANSQNSVRKGECDCPTWNTDSGCGAEHACWRYNTKTTCENITLTTTSCVWAEKDHSNLMYPNSPAGQKALDCRKAPWTRDNYIGLAKNGTFAHYDWPLPSASEACGNPNGCGQCYFRIRYNISTGDLDNLESWQVKESVLNDIVANDPTFDISTIDGHSIDGRFNGQRTIKLDEYNYYEDNPVMDLGLKKRALRLAHNTDQTIRAFQDRSHMFEVRKRPGNIASSRTIWNLNVKGKRGNIVQVYPAVEYDFVPGILKMQSNDLVHVQWIGSNQNPTGNNGQGQAGSDRNNMVQILAQNTNYPLAIEAVTMFGGDVDLTRAYATAGRGTGMDKTMNNASPYFDGYTAGGNSLLSLAPGMYHYASTRNNDFTNRSQKGQIIVTSAKSDAEHILNVNGASEL